VGKQEAMNMVNVYDKLIPVLAGIYALLLAYKVVPIKASDPEYSENWHKKYGALLKVLGFLAIAIGVVSLLFVLF
jgi:hypothetical protein